MIRIKRLTITFRSLSSMSELTRNSLSPLGFTRLLLRLTLPPSNIAFLAPPKTEKNILKFHKRKGDGFYSLGLSQYSGSWEVSSGIFSSGLILLTKTLLLL